MFAVTFPENGEMILKGKHVSFDEGISKLKANDQFATLSKDINDIPLHFSMDDPAAKILAVKILMIFQCMK